MQEGRQIELGQLLVVQVQLSHRQEAQGGLILLGGANMHPVDARGRVGKPHQRIGRARACIVVSDEAAIRLLDGEHGIRITVDVEAEHFALARPVHDYVR